MIQAMRRGLFDAIRFPAPLAILFSVYFVGALLLTLPIYNGLNQTLAPHLAAGEMARTFNVLTLFETLLDSVRFTQPPAAPAQGDEAAAILAVLTILFLMLGAGPLAALPNALLSGGALQVYADRQFTWRRFLWGCWHWALPFVVLWIVLGVVITLFIALGITLSIALTSLGAGKLGLLALALLLGAYFTLAMLLDYTRAIAVVERRRNVFWALGRAFRFALRHPGQAGGLYLALLALGYLLIVVYNQIATLIPFEWGIIGIALQQVLVTAQVWVRLGRWASLLALYQSVA